MNFLLASTSTLFGGNYLEYIKNEIAYLFEGLDEIIFIPYARASGLSHEEYTAKAQKFFAELGISARGLHEFDKPAEALNSAQGYFTGGGNTFLLVKTMHEHGLMEVLKQNIRSGKAYLGASAGSNLAGVSMKTTNDMPIVYPPSFDCMGIIPYNLNPHYLDPNPELKHNGETRETRIKEFLTQNDTTVIGLREGNWLRQRGESLTVEGPHTTRIFEKNKPPYEIVSGTRL
ncbi:dipeptidase E [Cruoricaptor ignavus]|uniref:Dipeptidase E n=1 Tax=Cruoricaptor ignavus TaxID=1118202 RepID=A0A1M6BX83_9FLAO|nr:dipeptidase PepE [Cruoricaptor ignavus]SHI53223.1 dipeptidase E [Cruoricaptor ignavus]